MIRKFHIKVIKNALDWYAVFIAVLGMGSLYFQVLRMPLMALLELSVAILYTIANKGKMSYTNLRFYTLLTSFFILTSIVNLHNGFYINDLIIWAANCLLVVSIQSNMKFEKFTSIFTKIMVAEAAVSMICYLWADVLGMTLPLMSSGSNMANSYYLTPYYTVGWGNAPIFHRNAGIYIEPGAHQIFLNFALLFLLGDNNHLGLKKKRNMTSLLILIIAILTTQSTSGYLAFVIVLASAIVKRNEHKNGRGNWLKIVAVILMILLVVVESETGVIENKLDGFSSGKGSSRTRYNDTYFGYYLALHKPIMGHGMYMTNLRSMLSPYGIVNISNGMASFAIRAGLVITVILLVIMYNSMKKRFPYGWFFNICMFLLFFLSVNTEGIFLNILFLLFIGQWRLNDFEKRNE